MVKSTDYIIDKNIEVFQFFEAKQKMIKKNEINFETIPISSTNKENMNYKIWAKYFLHI